MILSLSQQVPTPMHDDEKQKNYELAEKLISEQNFAAAVIAGAIAMLLAAVAYGIVVERWPTTYGFAAAGVGTVVGFFMGFLGRGISAKFSVVAAVFLAKRALSRSERLALGLYEARV
jgi:dipeptide/tripeptide permease